MRNKIIDIYGITHVCRAIVGNESRIQMHERTGFMADDGEPITLLGAAGQTIKVHDIPIHRIRTPEGDRFVAIEPDLKFLLELPFEARAVEAESRCRELVGLANAHANRVSARINEMLAMPWWRRALFVLRRSNLETQP